MQDCINRLDDRLDGLNDTKRKEIVQNGITEVDQKYAEIFKDFANIKENDLPSILVLAKK